MNTNNTVSTTVIPQIGNTQEVGFEIVQPVPDKQKVDHKGLAAANFYNERANGLVYLHGKCYLYDGTKYVEKEREELTLDLRWFLMRTKQEHTNSAVSNVLGDLLTLASRPVKDVKELPCYVGKHDFPRNVIPFKNGLLDVDEFLKGNAVLIEHTKDWISTFCLPYSFDPNAECPNWSAFMSQVFGGDQEKLDIMQEWFGYCLIPDIKYHKAMVKVGPPRSGKSTTDRIQQAVLGKDNTVGVELTCLADKFGLSRLDGKHVAFCGEVNINSHRDKYTIMSNFISIVGGDTVSIERKYSNDVKSVQLPTRFSISCNEVPQLADHSGAIASRLLILEYVESFVNNPDTELEPRLLSELAGILNWSLQGLVRLKQQGRFTTSTASKEVLEVQRQNNSQVYHFLCDTCEVHKRLNNGNLGTIRITDKDCEVQYDHLLAAYRTWCEVECKEVNSAYFGRQLAVLITGIKKERKIASDGSKRTVYPGLRIAV